MKPELSHPITPKQIRIRKGAGGWNVSLEPLDIIAAGAAVSAIILALAVLLGKLLVDKVTVSLFVGLVGASAVSAYLGVTKRKGRR